MSEYQTLAGYVQERRRYSDDEFRNMHGYPVLLHPPAEDSESGAAFDTQVAQPGTTALEISTGLMTSPAMLVVPILKRPGGAFPDRIGVGRTRSNDIALMYPEISKYHAYFTVTDEGEGCSITDAGSKNGTFVNAHPLEPRHPMFLHDRDIVSFGEQHFRFQTGEGFLTTVQHVHKAVSGG